MINTRTLPNDKTSRFANHPKGSKGGLSNEGHQSFITLKVGMRYLYSIYLKIYKKIKYTSVKCERSCVHKGKRRLWRQKHAPITHT